MENKKTISGGSDGSAGFITGGSGKLVPQGKPDPENQSDAVQEILGSQKAQALIQAAVRGATQAILEYQAKGMGLPAIAAHLSTENDKLGTDMAQVSADGNTENVVTRPAQNGPSVSTEPIPALHVVNDVPKQTVLDNSPIKQVDASPAADSPTAVTDNDYANAMEPANIPLSVPNYRKPEGPTTKICATCKYYTKKTESTGECFAYGFTAMADHTCDSWAVGTLQTNGVDSDRTRDIQNPIGQPVPNDIPPKYLEIDFYPNQPMSENAAQAIEARDAQVGENRGITPYAESCANRIIQKQILLPDHWRRIYSYCVDHADDPNSDAWEEKGPLWQQWMAWGGQDGFQRAKEVIEAMNQADEDEVANNVADAKAIRSMSKKRTKKITQAAGPVSTINPGEVISNEFEPVRGEDAGLPVPEDMSANVTPELSLSHGRGKSAFYLPGERVYSKSSHSLAEIAQSNFIDNQHIYSIRLIDADGLVRGSAVVHEGDLTPRSMRAIKRMQIKSIREGVEAYINQVIKSLEDMSAAHADLAENPITSTQMSDAEKQVQDILANETFADASSKMGMRKYVRALQDVEHSLGAGTHILKSAEDLAASDGNEETASKDAQAISNVGQKNAMFRIKQAIDRCKECLLDEVPMRSFAAKAE